MISVAIRFAKTIFRYCVYFAVSIIAGYTSSIGTPDLLERLTGNLFTILISIIILYTTLSNLVVNQVIDIGNKMKLDVKPVYGSLRRNVVIMFCIIAFDFIFMILAYARNTILDLNVIKPQITLLFPFLRFISVRMVINSITFFSIAYFLYVIYDTAKSFYFLLEKRDVVDKIKGVNYNADK